MRVLFVGDAGHATLVPALEDAGVAVAAAVDATDAATRARDEAFDAVLVADTVPRLGPVLRRLRDAAPPTVFVATGDAAALNEASAVGVDAVVSTGGGVDDAVATVERVAEDAAFDADAARVRRLGRLVERALRTDPDAVTVCEWLADAYGAAWTARLTDDGLRPETAVGVAAAALSPLQRPGGLDASGDAAVADGVTVLRVDADRALCIGVELDGSERRTLAPLGRVLGDASTDGDAVRTLGGALGHELNNHLQTVRTYLDLAAETGDTTHVETALDHLDRVDRVADDARALAAPDALDPDDVSLADAATAAWEHTPSDDATLDVTDDASVVADAALLELALENLFRNAVEHAGDDVSVTVGATDDGFYVADDGPGIPEPEREHVFEWGYSADGSGIGLALVRHVAERHDWTVRATDGETGGARFEFST